MRVAAAGQTIVALHWDGSVSRSTDAGKTWKPINGTGTGALPETPANWITVHPKVPGCRFLGTDIGLFYSEDDGTTWKTTKEGGNTSPIAELSWHNNRTLMVTTHGRGIFTVDVGEAPYSRRVGSGCGKTSAPTLAATVPTPGCSLVYAAHERGVHNVFTGYVPSPAIRYPSFGSVVAHELEALAAQNLPQADLSFDHLEHRPRMPTPN